MTAMAITMETKGTAVAVTARGQWPAWRRRRQLGKSTVLKAATSLAADVAAWQERGVGGGGQLGGGGGSLARARHW